MDSIEFQRDVHSRLSAEDAGMLDSPHLMAAVPKRDVSSEIHVVIVWS